MLMAFFLLYYLAGEFLYSIQTMPKLFSYFFMNSKSERGKKSGGNNLLQSLAQC